MCHVHDTDAKLIINLRLGIVIFDDGILDPFMFSATMLKRYCAMVETSILVWVIFEGSTKIISIFGHCGKIPLEVSAHPIMVYDVTGSKLPVGSSHENMIDIVSAENTIRVAEKFTTGSGTVASANSKGIVQLYKFPT